MPPYCVKKKNTRSSNLIDKKAVCDVVSRIFKKKLGIWSAVRKYGIKRSTLYS